MGSRTTLGQDTSTLWLSFDARAVRGKDGAVRLYEGFVSDVAARKQAEQETIRLAHLHAVVADLGQRALRLDPSMDIQDEAVQLVARTLEVEYANVMEVRPDGSFLLRAGIGWKEGQVGHAVVASEGSQPGFTLSAGHAVTAEDALAESRFVPVARTLGEPVASTVSVVTPTRQSPYGTLGVHARRRRKFTPDEVDFLQSIPRSAGRRAHHPFAAHRGRLLRLLRTRGEGLPRSARRGRDGQGGPGGAAQRGHEEPVPRGALAPHGHVGGRRASGAAGDRDPRAHPPGPPAHLHRELRDPLLHANRRREATPLLRRLRSHRRLAPAPADGPLRCPARREPSARRPRRRDLRPGLGSPHTAAYAVTGILLLVLIVNGWRARRRQPLTPAAATVNPYRVPKHLREKRPAPRWTSR